MGKGSAASAAAAAATKNRAFEKLREANIALEHDGKRCAECRAPIRGRYGMRYCGDRCRQRAHRRRARVVTGDRS